MIRLGIAVSGRGSNLKALTSGIRKDSRFDLPLVLADQPCAGLEWAKEQGLKTTLLPYEQGRGPAERELERLWQAEGLQGLLLAGFMRVLSAPFVQAHEGRILNIHPSLLPRFKGAHALDDFWASDESRGGLSVHIVTPELDGGPLLAQESLRREGHDRESYEQTIHELEHRLYWPTAQAFFTR